MMANHFSLQSPGRMWGRSGVPAVLGLLLPFASIAVAEGGGIWIRLAVLAGVTLAWLALFGIIRRQPPELQTLVSAAIVALCTPATAPLWQLAVGMSFGVVIGEQVFGGRSRSFLSAAVVTLTFLMFSFTDQPYRAGPDLPFWTMAPALVLLVHVGQASWRVLAAAGVVMLLLSLVLGDGQPGAMLLNGSVLLVLIFLAADPIASAATNPGRLAYGGLVGLLAMLFREVGDSFGAMVFAVLLGSIFAPLIDHVVVHFNARHRPGRHG